jgi:hypothetical protein
LTVLLLFVAVFCVLWFGISPRVPKAPVQLVRDEDGQMVPTGSSEQPGGSSFAVHAGTTAANSTFTSASSASRPEGSGFACGRLLIVNRSDHLLMARIGQELLERLKPLSFIHQIDYYPAGFAPERAKLAPDVTVTLDLESLKESGWPLSHTVEATIKIKAGNGAPDCSYSSFDHLTRPLLGLDWTAKLTHQSTTKGVCSSGAKYKQVAEDAAKQIAESLGKEFKERREKEGVLPELPPAFYPPYREPPTLPLAEFGKPDLVTSWHGLMNHNETLWQLTIDRPAGEVLAEMARRLGSAGWKGSLPSGSEKRTYLALANGAATLVVYVPSQTLSSGQSASKDSVLRVHYVDRMTQEELRAAIDGLIDHNALTDVLICFEHEWSEDQCRRVLKTLESRPARTPRAALAVANVHRRLKQNDQARRELLRACALLRTVAQYSDLETRARSLAKELGDEKLVEKPIEVQMLKELGFIELKPGVQVPPQEIGLEEPVHFYIKKADGKVKTLSLRAIKCGSKKTEASHELACVESWESSRSCCTGGMSHYAFVDDKCGAQFDLEQTSPQRFRLQTKLTGR